MNAKRKELRETKENQDKELETLKQDLLSKLG